MKIEKQFFIELNKLEEEKESECKIIKEKHQMIKGLLERIDKGIQFSSILKDYFEYHQEYKLIQTILPLLKQKLNELQQVKSVYSLTEYSLEAILEQSQENIKVLQKAKRKQIEFTFLYFLWIVELFNLSREEVQEHVNLHQCDEETFYQVEEVASQLKKTLTFKLTYKI